jgi:hypothetical protein
MAADAAARSMVKDASDETRCTGRSSPIHPP